MLHKFFRKIQNQLLVLILLTTLIPVLIVSWYGIYSYTTVLSEFSLSQLDNQVIESTEKIASFLEALNRDIVFISKVPPVQGIIRARSGSGIDQQENSTYSIWVERLENIFMAMMEAKPYYMQLRYLDENGNEIVRVDSDSNQIKVVPKNQLQNKSDRSYFTDAMKLGPGQIYISEVNLNQEFGKIEIPYKPVIRYAIPIFDSNGQKKGIIISNIFANHFINLIKQTKGLLGTQAFIVDQNGYYLYHPDSQKEWGVDLKINENIKNDYPPAIATQVLSGGKGHIAQQTDEIISYSTVVFNAEKNLSLVIVYHCPKAVVFAALNAFKTTAGAIIFLSLAIVFPLGIFRLRQVVNLIRQLVNSISTFSVDIVSTLDQQTRIAQHQYSSVNNTTNTMQEFEVFSQQTATQAENVATSARQALNLASEGTNLMEKTLEGLLTLKEKVIVISEQTQRLGSQTSQIGNISSLAGLVSDLANQTNMLALNAAVEAVRAGEHGKGFGVVATEIRQLADQSRAAAEKINAIVPEIQAAIKATVKATDEGSHTLTSGLKTAEKASHAFNGVREAANNVFISNQQISLNANRQAVAIQEIVKTMNALNREAAQTAAGIGYTKTGVQKLNDHALALKAMV